MPLCFVFPLFFFLTEEPSTAGEKERKYYDIVKRIEKAAGMAIRIKILPLDILESYIYPDGAIVITEGLIKLIHNDDELAFILSHEVSHLKKRNLPEDMALSFFLEDAQYPGWLKIEMEADIFAVHLMRKAGYSPESAITVFSRMNPEDIPSYSLRIYSLYKYLENAPVHPLPGLWEESDLWEAPDGGFGE